jgi:hypothetical protein
LGAQILQRSKAQRFPTARFCKCLKRLAPQVGLESTFKRRFNNMQGHGWHKST